MSELGVIARHARVPLRLGRRFDPAPHVNAFVAELERCYRSELQSGATAQRFGGSTCR